MKLLFVAASIFLSGCAMKSPVTDSPKYAGARAASGETSGWYATITGGGEAAGCGVGTSEETIHGNLEINLKSPECDLNYKTGSGF